MHLHHLDPTNMQYDCEKGQGELYIPQMHGYIYRIGYHSIEAR